MEFSLCPIPCVPFERNYSEFVFVQTYAPDRDPLVEQTVSWPCEEMRWMASLKFGALKPEDQRPSV